MKAKPELARYWGWDPTTQRWELLVLTNGWIDLRSYLREIKQWARDVQRPYTCFAITAWSRGQQETIELDAWRREAACPGSVVYPIH